MNWVLIVLFGATINALVNYGYKKCGVKLDITVLIGIVMGIAAVLMGFYAVFSGVSVGAVFENKILISILLMGIGTAIVWLVFVKVLTLGPISLVDPMWACIYALVSILIGMGMAHESPKLISLLGVAVYLVGVALIAYGGRKSS